MTKFEKKNFHYSGGYLSYQVEPFPARPVFIARFKYNKGRRAPFMKFLMKNFTVESYLAQYATGLAPLQILHAAGFKE